jgi:glutathione S-transferase
MANFTIHTIPGSPFARAVLATLFEKGATCAVAAIPPDGLKGEDHLKRHPFGRMPVLEHGAFRLYETQAILRYIDRVLPEPALTPGDAQVAARMDQVMNISDWYLFQGVANVIVFQRIVGPTLMGLAPNEHAVADAMPKAHVVFDELSRLLGHQPYFCGERVSLADLHVAAQLDLLALTPEWAVLSAKTPNLSEWLARMNARPSMQATTWERVVAIAEASKAPL